MFADRYFGARYFGNRYFAPVFRFGGQPGDGFAPSGGYYRRPIIYLDRDGNPVDLATYGKEPEPVDLPALLELTPEILRALLAERLEPQPSPFDLAAGLDARMGDMLLRQEITRMQDDDAALALLLSA